MPEIIFVSGVHGVGKGTLCKKIESELTFPHFSASSLIKSVKNAKVDSNKVVIDADKNQDHLLMAIEQLNVDSEYILIDGHFCLQGSSGVFEVPIDTFKGMNIAAIILLTDDPKEIHKRLYGRDKNALDIAVIESLQNAEADRATHVASSLNIPLFEIKIYDMAPMLSWIKDTIQHSSL